MASPIQVRQYLAYWFQLGKRLLIRNGEESRLPSVIIQGNCYSQEFEACWQLAQDPESADCYLEGTNQTIAELLTPAWEIQPCSRCDMPLPIVSLGMPPEVCPCYDIPNWPNTDIPVPRSPVDDQAHLTDIHKRLQREKL
ncbi:MAG: hypothetical protein F6K19_27340 [Cyanothece sp. SIO1E1]|nr:hypothetical protein [Cyanothece sp. SIO1E1]